MFFGSVFADALDRAGSVFGWFMSALNTRSSADGDFYAVLESRDGRHGLSS
jgi:hypothetical protein